MAAGRKFCGGCETEKSTDAFNKMSASASGLQSQCRQCLAEKRRLWGTANPDAEKALKAAHRVRRREHIRGRDRRYYVANSTELRSRANNYYNTVGRHTLAALRTDALRHLGGVCCRCQFADPRALQVDHVEGGGTKDRKVLGAFGIYRAVLELEPGTKYQLLCANCNWIKRHEEGEINGYRLLVAS